MESTSEGGSGLAAALAKVQGELSSIPQTKTVNVNTEKGSYSYTYADLAEVVKAVYPIMSKHGLAYLAKPTTNDEGHFVLAYALLHESGEREDGEYPLPTGGTPQPLGSAITYARRYTFCAVVGVAAEEDTDGRGTVAQTTARPKQRRRQQQPESDWEMEDSVRTPSLAHGDQRVELRGRMGWLIGQVGLNMAEAIAVVSQYAGREVTDSRTLTVEELTKINTALERLLADQVLAPAQDQAEPSIDTETGEVEMITHTTQRRQRAQRKELGLEKDESFWEWLEVQFGRPFTSSKEQSEVEALEACRRMQIMVDAAREQEEGGQ